MAVMTTNYTDTFIGVSPDCPVEHAQVPPARGSSVSVAQLQYEMLEAAPYVHTSDDVLFAVHAERNAIAEEESDRERAAFFAKPRACLRSSPLAKRYGWGFHHDADGRVALVALGSDNYRELAGDTSLKHVAAMRSKRA